MTQLETLLFPNQGTGNESPTQRYTHFLSHAVFHRNPIGITQEKS